MRFDMAAGPVFVTVAVRLSSPTGCASGHVAQQYGWTSDSYPACKKLCPATVRLRMGAARLKVKVSLASPWTPCSNG